jgi:hypothetical protein
MIHVPAANITIFQEIQISPSQIRDIIEKLGKTIIFTNDEKCYFVSEPKASIEARLKIAEEQYQDRLELATKKQLEARKTESKPISY